MSSTVNYKPLTKEDLGKGLREQIQPENRNFYVETGPEGMKQFHRSIERSGIDMSIEMLLTEGKLTIHELAGITKMLDSTDDRDYKLAKLIINSKYESDI